MKIIIGSDHAGFQLKEHLKKTLSKEITFIDVGTNSADSVDYPDFGFAVADKIAKGEAEFGIVICGSGIGISIAANRNPKVRCALCVTENMAKLARQHNDANVLALGARLVSAPEAEDIIAAFLETPFEGGRHAKRVEKLGL
jgi:ribose 5-phosphate isomerase B